MTDHTHIFVDEKIKTKRLKLLARIMRACLNICSLFYALITLEEPPKPTQVLKDYSN